MRRGLTLPAALALLVVIGVAVFVVAGAIATSESNSKPLGIGDNAVVTSRTWVNYVSRITPDSNGRPRLRDMYPQGCALYTGTRVKILGIQGGDVIGMPNMHSLSKDEAPDMCSELDIVRIQLSALNRYQITF